MRKSISKLALAATFGLALSFTFSCSSGGSDDGGGNSNGSNNSGGNNDGSPKEVISTMVAQSTTYDTDGNIKDITITKARYEYDSRGNITKLIDADGNIANKYEYEYDNRGNITKLVLDIAYSNITTQAEYEYDSRDNPIKVIQYDADGNIILRTENGYNSNGNQTKVIYYNADGSIIIGRVEYEYDSKGNQTKVIQYDADGNIISRTEYDWNSDGSYCTYTQNLYYSTVEISYTVETRYITINSEKLVVNQTSTNSTGTGSKQEYEYDSKGNTTKKTSYSWKADTGSYVKSEEIIYTYTYIKL